MDDNEILHEGLMRKRGNRVKSMWGERYFILRGHVLYYYMKKTDTEPKGVITLSTSCKLSDIRQDNKRKQYIFTISWSNIIIDDDNNEERNTNDINISDDKILLKNKGKSKSKRIQNSHSKVAASAVGGVAVGSVTGGMGLFASLMFLGLGSTTTTNTSSSSNSYNGTNNHEPEKTIVLSCDTLYDAQKWINVLEKQIKDLNDIILPNNIHTNLSISSTRNAPPPEIRLDDVEEWIKSSKWKVIEVFDGLRIFQQSNTIDSLDNVCLRVNVGINGSVNDVSSAIMSLPPACRTGILKSLRVVETIDNCTDIIHLMLEPVYIFPTWTAPRDFCLKRYWKHNSDGSYVICYDSTFHQDCPLVMGYLRADLHAAYYISPLRDDYYDDDEQQNECLLTMIAQINPKGWIWKSLGYQNNFLKQFLLHVLDFRDYIDTERFVQVQFDTTDDKLTNNISNNVIEDPDSSSDTNLGTIPPANLSTEMWGESDASTFRVRGLTYLQDKVKTNSMPSLFKLVAVDVFEVPEATHNISANPKNRVYLAHQRGEKFWAFVVNIMVPGPPHLSFVMYYQGDKSLIEQDTPFGRVAKPFFFGNDDEFRNNRFKLIPKVIDGNIIVKMAVKDTPTLLGNKLKQYYYKDDHYFELDVDVGSSSVARNVCGLAIGYSKAIVVDMGVCLQGNEESELPEIMMGACRCNHVDMSLAKKL